MLLNADYITILYQKLLILNQDY